MFISRVGRWLNRMNIIEIYKKYHLSENLQMHMLRVAALYKEVFNCSIIL